MMDSKSLARAREGFSLIELILYIALFGSMVAAITAAITLMAQTDAKIIAAAEVQEMTMFVVNRVEQAVEGAMQIDLPASGSGNVLALQMRNPAENPTRIEVQDETLQIVVGSGLTLSNLTSSRVRVTNFTVTRIPSVTGGAVRIQYTLVSDLKNVNKQSTVMFTQTLSLHK